MPFQTKLILGGARSGKSNHAQRTAALAGLEPVLIATAKPSDPEMEARIARHRLDRPPGWRVVEEPVEIVAACRIWRRPDRIVTIDCLTLWLSSLMEAETDVVAATKSLVMEIARPAGPLILVSNEIGYGLVPLTEVGRRFRDDHGRMNQAVAAACDQVVLVAAGLPLTLKPMAGATG